MTVKSMLSDLRRSTKLLSKIDARLRKVEAEERQQTLGLLPKHQRPAEVFNETFAIHPVRSIVDAKLADLASALNLVSLYGTLLSGQPLIFQGIDMYSSPMGRDPGATLNQFFREQTSGASGLEGVLRETGKEEITDAEVFATYRAIGCQSVDMWGVSVHRIVGGVCSEAEKLADALLGHDDG